MKTTSSNVAVTGAPERKPARKEQHDDCDDNADGCQLIIGFTAGPIPTVVTASQIANAMTKAAMAASMLR